MSLGTKRGASGGAVSSDIKLLDYSSTDAYLTVSVEDGILDATRRGAFGPTNTGSYTYSLIFRAHTTVPVKLVITDVGHTSYYRYRLTINGTSATYGPTGSINKTININETGTIQLELENVNLQSGSTNLIVNMQKLTS